MICVRWPSVDGIIEFAVSQHSDCTILELHLVCSQSPRFIAKNMLDHAKLFIQSERADLAESLPYIAEHFWVSLHTESLRQLYDLHRDN